MKPLIKNTPKNTFHTGSNDFSNPPFEHKVVLEKLYTNEVHLDEGDSFEEYGETYGLIRFIEPTGRGMMGNKYLKWLRENLGGLMKRCQKLS